jgi:hypothetical protein
LDHAHIIPRKLYYNYRTLSLRLAPRLTFKVSFVSHASNCMLSFHCHHNNRNIDPEHKLPKFMSNSVPNHLPNGFDMYPESERELRYFVRNNVFTNYSLLLLVDRIIILEHEWQHHLFTKNCLLLLNHK